MLDHNYSALFFRKAALGQKITSQWYIQIIDRPSKNTGGVGRQIHIVSSGDYIGVVTPVPIPNTEVKHSEPMIVPTSVKVGIAGIFQTQKGSMDPSMEPFFARFGLLPVPEPAPPANPAPPINAAQPPCLSPSRLSSPQPVAVFCLRPATTRRFRSIENAR